MGAVCGQSRDWRILVVWLNCGSAGESFTAIQISLLYLFAFAFWCYLQHVFLCCFLVENVGSVVVNVSVSVGSCVFYVVWWCVCVHRFRIHILLLHRKRFTYRVPMFDYFPWCFILCGIKLCCYTYSEGTAFRPPHEQWHRVPLSFVMCCFRHSPYLSVYMSPPLPCVDSIVARCSNTSAVFVSLAPADLWSQPILKHSGGIENMIYIYAKNWNNEESRIS